MQEEVVKIYLSKVAKQKLLIKPVVEEQKPELESLLNDIMSSDEEACESCTI